MFDNCKGGINMQDRIMKEMSLYDKLNILSDAAKYDVSCTSSGVERRGWNRDGKLPESRDMPQFFLGWQMYFSSEDFIYE